MITGIRRDRANVEPHSDPVLHLPKLTAKKSVHHETARKERATTPNEEPGPCISLTDDGNVCTFQADVNIIEEDFLFLKTGRFQKLVLQLLNMPIVSLQELQKRSIDVLIIGGGTSGLVLATRYVFNSGVGIFPH